MAAAMVVSAAIGIAARPPVLAKAVRSTAKDITATYAKADTLHPARAIHAMIVTGPPVRIAIRLHIFALLAAASPATTAASKGNQFPTTSRFENGRKRASSTCCHTT